MISHSLNKPGDIFKHFSILPFFQKKIEFLLEGGRTSKYFVVRERTFQNILEGCKINDFYVFTCWKGEFLEVLHAPYLAVEHRKEVDSGSVNGTFTLKNQIVKKNCGGRSSFKTQLKIEYLLPYTGSRKVLENIPEATIYTHLHACSRFFPVISYNSRNSVTANKPFVLIYN